MTAAERKTFMDCSPAFSSQHTTTRTATPSTLEALWPSRHNRSDLQDLGDCVQSSQIGPHLVQPLRARPSAIALKISINRLNMAAPCPRLYHRASSQAFSSRAASVHFHQMHLRMPVAARNQPSCNTNNRP